MKHSNKELIRLLDKAQKFGCRVEDCGNSVRIYPSNKSIQPYIAHKGERALHPVRRYLKNTCGFLI